MENYNKNTRSKKPLTKNKFIAIIAGIIAAIVLVSAGIGFAIGKFAGKDKEAETTAPSSAETTQAVTQTQAPTEKVFEGPQKMDKIMICTADTLNIRSEPNTESSVIGLYAEGNEVKVIGRYDADWYIVLANGQKGYCVATYLVDKNDYEQGAVAPNPQSGAPYMLYVNRKQNIVIAYAKDANGEYNVPKKAMICSVGNYQGETPVGTFNTTDKYTWRALVGGVYGQYATRITGHILFHSVPYNSQNKGDLNPAEYNKLGVPASHGCIRLSVADAKWIYDNCPSGTPVKIYDSDKKEPLARPSAQKIDLNSPNRGWDPTDPDKNNPWNR